MGKTLLTINSSSEDQELISLFTLCNCTPEFTYSLPFSSVIIKE